MKHFFLTAFLLFSFTAYGGFFGGVSTGNVVLVDGSNPMTDDLDMAGNEILNVDISASETDPKSILTDGSGGTPTATIGWGNQDLEGVKILQLDTGTGIKYKLRQIYGIAMGFQPETGDGAFIHAMPSDDSATKNVGFVINRRVGVDAAGAATGGPIDVLNFFFIPGRNAYVMETKSFFGGSLFDLWIDHAGDGNPEWIFKVNGESSAENNPITNIGSLEIDPGTGTAYVINQLPVFGADELIVKSKNFDTILAIASEFDDGLSPSKLRIYRLGSEFTDKEYLDIGLLASGGEWLISSQKEGTGTVRSIGIDSTGNGTADSIFKTDGTLSLESHKIVNLADGVAASDGVNKGQLDMATNGAQMDSIQTTDGNAVTITTFTAGVDFMDDDAVVVRAFCSGMKSDGTQAIGQEVIATFRKNGAATTVQVQSSTDIFRNSDDAQWDADFTLSGSDILLQVEGNAGDTIEWSCSSTILTRNAV